MSGQYNMNFHRKLIDTIYRYAAISREPAVTEAGIK